MKRKLREPGKWKSPGRGEVYFIAEDDIVSDAHIQTTRAIETATGLSVNLWLTEEGVSRLSEATRSHIGGRLAILVGSKLVNAPVIRSEIGSSGATLGLTLPAAEARSVAAAIATRFESGD